MARSADCKFSVNLIKKSFTKRFWANILILRRIEPEDNHKYYFCYDQNHVIDITRDLKNIAQLRILGEQEYYNFVKTDGVLGFIANAFNDLEKLKSEIEDTISDVKQRAEALRLHLSSAIRYSVQ